jgi:hypothetical protein
MKEVYCCWDNVHKRKLLVEYAETGLLQDSSSYMSGG